MNIRLLDVEDPSVLHWVAEVDGSVVGFVYCHLERRRTRDTYQLLLYEIEVVESHRRLGVGRALVEAMEAWMREREIAEVWVLADNPDAEAFYASCGFVRSAAQPVQYEKRLE